MLPELNRITAAIAPVSAPDSINKSDSAKAKDAAQQFEALLLGQILRSVREAAGSQNSDEAANCATEFAEQQLALVLARQGGLGLAALIARGLDRKPAASEAPSPGRGPDL